MKVTFFRNSAKTAIQQLPKRMSSQLTPQAGGAVVSPGLTQVSSETLGEKVYRYLDITGFLTRWNNRKEWVMDLDPMTRLNAVMMTEWERKLHLFIGIHAYIFYAISVMVWAHAWGHLSVKPPCPRPPDYDYMNKRKRDFYFMHALPFKRPKGRCKECRPLEGDCKKECFDRLRAEGHKFFIDPLIKPRFTLEPPHTHH